MKQFTKKTSQLQPSRIQFSISSFPLIPGPHSLGPAPSLTPTGDVTPFTMDTTPLVTMITNTAQDTSIMDLSLPSVASSLEVSDLDISDLSAEDHIPPYLPSSTAEDLPPLPDLDLLDGIAATTPCNLTPTNIRSFLFPSYSGLEESLSLLSTTEEITTPSSLPSCGPLPSPSCGHSPSCGPLPKPPPPCGPSPSCGPVRTRRRYTAESRNAAISPGRMRKASGSARNEVARALGVTAAELFDANRGGAKRRIRRVASAI
eukprot:sb/3468468/